MLMSSMDNRSASPTTAWTSSSSSRGPWAPSARAALADTEDATPPDGALFSGEREEGLETAVGPLEDGEENDAADEDAEDPTAAETPPPAAGEPLGETTPFEAASGDDMTVK